MCSDSERIFPTLRFLVTSVDSEPFNIVVVIYRQMRKPGVELGNWKGGSMHILAQGILIIIDINNVIFCHESLNTLMLPLVYHLGLLLPTLYMRTVCIHWGLDSRFFITAKSVIQ